MRHRFTAGLLATTIGASLLAVGTPAAYASSKGRKNTSLGLGAVAIYTRTADTTRTMAGRVHPAALPATDTAARVTMTMTASPVTEASKMPRTARPAGRTAASADGGVSRCRRATGVATEGDQV